VKDLREFVDKIRDLGELKLVEGANWDLEIGAVTFLAAQDPNPPALLFDRIEGYSPGYRVLSIPYSTYKRIALVLGLPSDSKRLDLVRKIRSKLSQPLKLIPPVEVKDAPVLQNVHTGTEVNLLEFPTPRWFSKDGGRYIGLGDNVIMKDPEEGWVNVGTYRVQVHDQTTATINLEPGKHGRFIREKYWEKGQACPVAVTCGGDPMLVCVGAASLPWGTPEYDYAGWWKNEPVEVISGPTTGLPIPAHAEIVLEGEIVPPEIETRMEGPFSEWTGHYSPAKPDGAFRVKCVMHRNDPIILGHLVYLGPGIICGWTDLFAAAQVWSHLDKIVPGVKAVWSPPELKKSMVISIEQKYGGHAKQTALGALAQHSYDRRFIIVVDEDVDPSDIRQVLFALALRSDPERFDIIKDSWCCNLNPILTPYQREVGDITHSVAVITACKPYHWIKEFPPSVELTEELKENVLEKWKGKILEGS